MIQPMNKKLFSTAARRIAALLLLLCLSATTTWAIKFVYVTVPVGSPKGGRATMPDTYNYPHRIYVIPQSGFVIESVVCEQKENGVVIDTRTLTKIGVKESTRGEYYNVLDPENSTVTITFRQQSSNVEVNFDMTASDVQGPAKQNQQIGNYVTKPDDPEDVNFTFFGWFTDEKCQKPFDFNTALDYTLPYESYAEKSVLNLYAKWQSNWSWKYMSDDENILHIIGPGPMDDYKSKKAP